jgi:phosphopantothenoylcysteine decarboxylase/phosphopantothenate--cysteine ligase
MKTGKHVTLAVTGCIGAYKAVLILRGLQNAGVDVEVVMTKHATEFVKPLTFQAISGRPVVTDHWNRDEDRDILHIALPQRTDLLIVAPATANTIAKFSNGIADDFLSTMYLALTRPVLIAPAMNVEMWRHPATRENVARLRARGATIVEPGAGFLACGMVGEGRLAEPDEIVAKAIEILGRETRTDLVGEHVLVTAGPTVEDLDPVRFLTNRSSGKMGYAVAEAARDRGARVTLVTGPTRLEAPAGVEVVRVRSTRQMYDAVLETLKTATIVVKSAAVCDFRPARIAEGKIKKNDQMNSLRIELEPTEDILAEVGRRKGDRVVVGFAAETDPDPEQALAKMHRKNADLLVLNDVTQPDAGFDTDTNRVTIFTSDGGKRELPLLSKREVAEAILDSAVHWKKDRMR